MLSEIIRMFRIQKRWSQTTLAVKVGKYQRFVSDIETGKRVPTQKEVAQISRALGVDPNLLSGGAQ